MADIDTSIYGNVYRPQMPDMMDMMQKGINLQQLGMQQRRMQMEEQEAQRALADKDALRNSYVVGADGKLDKAATLSNMYKAGLGKQAVESQQAWAKADADILKQHSDALEAKIGQLGAIGQLAAGVKDDQTLGAALDHAASIGLDVGPIPRSYQQAKPYLDRYVAMSTKQSERMAAQHQRIQEQLAERTQNFKEWDENRKFALERPKTLAETRRADAEAKKFIAEANSPATQFKNLPVENQEQIKKLADQSAGKIGIATQIDSTVKLIEDPKVNPEQKLMQARQMIKVLNSTQGQDAVGAEESKRLAGLLEYRILNLTEPGPMFGRAPIEDFAQQAKLTSKSLKDAYQSSQGMIEQLKGGGQLQVDSPSVESIAAKKKQGGAIKEAIAAEPPAPPKHGTVEDGFVFMGGDPANPKNWKRER